jgi:hypothetical protein
VNRSTARLLRAVGLSLVLGGVLVVVGFTLATVREIQLIEAAFGELATDTGAGRDAMLRQLIVVGSLGLLGVAVGVALVVVARRGLRAATAVDPHDDAAVGDGTPPPG